MKNNSSSIKNIEDMSKTDLLEEIEHLNFFIKATMEHAYEWNIDKDELFISEQLSYLLGYDEQFIKPETMRESIHPDHIVSHRNNTVAHFKGHTKRVRMEFQLQDRDNKYRWVAENGISLHDDTGRAIRYVGTIRDITGRKAAEDEMLESNARLLAITENASSPITLKDNEGRYVMVNDIFCKNRGVARAETIGKTVHDIYTSDVAATITIQDKAVLASGGAMQFEINSIESDGQLHTFISERFPVFSANGKLTGVGEINTDITERKKLDAALRVSEREMRLLAATDPLTGAKNRRSFFESGNQELARSKRYKRPLSILMMDIDHFKKVNDDFGHAAGDAVLKNLVNACHKMLREQDILGRLGGEEFGIILPEISINTAYLIAERLRIQLMKLEIISEDKTILFTVSIGLGQCEKDTPYLEDALSQADRALYRAKQEGRNRVCQ